MSEDFQLEDHAEKLAESPDEVVKKYLTKHSRAGKEKLIKILTERCDLSRDEAEKIVNSHLKKRKLPYKKLEDRYNRPHMSIGRPSFSKYAGMRAPPRRKAKARLESVLKLPPDPHTLPSKSHFLAKDWHPYYIPAMDKDRLGYLRAKEKMGAGADWPA